MRRWLVLALLALLPLQFTWAAVSAYCVHETGAQAGHLGHHAHQHAERSGDQPVHTAQADPARAALADPAAAALADPGSPAGGGFDVDCGQCHGAGLSLPAPAGGLLPTTRGVRPPISDAGALRTWAPSPPDRPQWLGLA